MCCKLRLFLYFFESGPIQSKVKRCPIRGLNASQIMVEYEMTHVCVHCAPLIYGTISPKHSHIKESNKKVTLTKSLSLNKKMWGHKASKELNAALYCNQNVDDVTC